MAAKSRAKQGGSPRTAAVRERTAPPFELSRLLLDTHTWLWWQADSRRLGPVARRAIAKAGEVWLSAASVWEMSIKASLGKLTLPQNADLHGELIVQGFRSLPIDFSHAIAVHALEPLHRDPFDRMLVAQAHVEGLTIVTADESIVHYGGRVLLATS